LIGPNYRSSKYAYSTRCIAKVGSVRPAKKPCGNLAMEIFLNGNDVCMLKYNVGDKSELPIPNTIYKNIAGSETCTPSTSQYCCWQGVTSSNCDTKNGNYSGCNRTVCDWGAAKEACAKLTYENRTWRLPTNDELSSLGTQLNKLSFGKKEDGLMLCDIGYTTNSAYCTPGTNFCFGVNNNTCDAYVLWSNSTYTNYYLSNDSFLGPETHSQQAYSVRCVSDL